MTTHTNAPPPMAAGPDDPRFRVFVESVRDYALLMLDPAGHIVSWNVGAQAIKGYRPDEIIGKHFSVFYPPEVVASGLPARELEGAARNGRFEDEGWRVRKDGTRFWANVVITALRDSSGTLTGYAKVTRDLTERRRHEETLRASEARFRSLIEGVRDYAIFMLSVSGHVTSWNSGAQAIIGYDPPEIIGKHLSTFYPPDAAASGAAEREIQSAIIDGRFEDEGWRMRKDGSRFWADVVLTALRGSRGELLGFSKITRDLTERRAHEAELRASESRLRMLVDGVVDYAIITIDLDGFVTTWNAGALRITGYKAAEIVGRHFSRLYPPEDIQANKPWQQLAMARESGRVAEESWRIRKDGTQFWANSVIAMLRDPDDRPASFYILCQDLTQRRHAESLADTAQRMQEFIAMLAHELRNPLAPIRNALAVMGRKGLQDPTLDSMRVIIERQAGLLTRIVDELLDVNRIARGQLSIERQSIDLRDVLARAIETSRPLIDARRQLLHLNIPDVPIECNGDAMRLTQVFVNILNNASKYTQDEGQIWLAARHFDDQVEMSVRDNGKGIDRAEIERIFDLFMQLDPGGNSSQGGLGVGLALVRRIVELHGGTVQAKSDGRGAGSEFVVRLPMSVAIPILPPAQVMGGGAAAPLRIVVVDDNVDSANSLSLLLGSMGHEVRAAYDGPSAIVICDHFRPNAALLDLGMPGMNGYEVARALRRNHGNSMMLVAVTGWGDDIARARAREAGFEKHVVKPLDQKGLHELLGEIAVRPSVTGA